FPEYLLFRFILLSFRRAFRSVQVPKSVNNKFESDDFSIGQSIPIGVRGYRPDMSFWIKNELVGVIEVKGYLSEGYASFENDLNKLKKIHEVKPDAILRMVIFWQESEKGSIM